MRRGKAQKIEIADAIIALECSPRRPRGRRNWLLIASAMHLVFERDQVHGDQG